MLLIFREYDVYNYNAKDLKPLRVGGCEGSVGPGVVRMRASTLRQSACHTGKLRVKMRVNREKDNDCTVRAMLLPRGCSYCSVDRRRLKSKWEGENKENEGKGVVVREGRKGGCS